jgi:hypothetical protein
MLQQISLESLLSGCFQIDDEPLCAGSAHASPGRDIQRSLHGVVSQSCSGKSE